MWSELNDDSLVKEVENNNANGYYSSTDAYEAALNYARASALKKAMKDKSPDSKTYLYAQRWEKQTGNKVSSLVGSFDPAITSDFFLSDAGYKAKNGANATRSGNFYYDNTSTRAAYDKATKQDNNIVNVFSNTLKNPRKQLKTDIERQAIQRGKK